MCPCVSHWNQVNSEELDVVSRVEEASMLLQTNKTTVMNLIVSVGVKLHRHVDRQETQD